MKTFPVPVLAELKQRLKSAKDDLNILGEARESISQPQHMLATGIPGASLSGNSRGGENLIMNTKERSGWGYQVNRNDFRAHYFDRGDSLCGKKTGGGYMSSTLFHPVCKTCQRRFPAFVPLPKSLR